MSTKATVKMGVDDTEVKTGVSRVKAGLKAMSEAAVAESAKVAAVMREISNLQLKKVKAEQAGDTFGAEAIQREIALTKELDSIRRNSNSESDRIIMQTQARQRKNIADEIAAKERVSSIEQAVGEVQRKNASDAQRHLQEQLRAQDELIKKGIAADAANQKQLAAKQDEQRLSRAQVQVARQNLQATEKQGAASLRVSQMQTQMAQLRVQGNHKAADEVQREIALHHELAQIMQSNATSAQRAILRQQALQRHSMGPAGGSAGAANQRMANVSAQIQDIAVQTQMGASIGTIVSQQGGQLISALGGSKALALGAGVATVAAAVISLGVAGNEAFAKLIKGSHDFGKELRNITAGGSLEQIVSGVGEAVEQIQILDDVQKSFDQNQKGFWAANAATMRTNWANLRNFSTKGAQGELDATEEEQFQRQLESNAAVSEAIALGKKEVAIAQMRARGLSEEADAAQRKLDLQRALAKVDANDKIPDRLKVSQKDTLIDKDKAKTDEIAFKKEEERIAAISRQADDEMDRRMDAIKELRDFEQKQVEEFRQHEKKIEDDSAKDEKFFANLEFEAMNEFYDEEEKRLDKIQKQKDKQIDRELRASDALADAKKSLADAQEKRMSLSDQITLASDRLLQSERMVAQTQKLGTKEAQDAAKAKMIQARGTLQELSLQRAAQFVGKSSADVRREDRNEAKEKRELEKAGKRSIEADIRKADAEARKATAQNPFGRGGLSEKDKAAMRAQGNKAQGADLKADAAAASAKSLQSIEADIKTLAAELKSA